MVNCNCVLLVISCILINVRALQTDKCQETVTSFSVSTQRNNSGHWYSEVTMDFLTDKGSDGYKRHSGPRNVGVSFYNKRCDGKESLSIVTAITVPPPKPGPGYELFAGVGYYKFHTTKETWSDARRICVAEGGHLAILNSDTEANIAKQLFSKHKQLDSWAFIGFHDENKEGEYITIFDEPLHTTGYTKWGSGQPDNYQNNEDCGSVDHEGRLNDYPCGAKAPFICECEL
ncbi:hemolymph lipopolysaccharide-binding protein-like [Schistocerca gregaria]|uniref:hemolymph lipopolysaccharide-binding protein-like n=1 Tax=Schistocerca gregaria TaxID=7010 RepID=UPI00211EAAB5|nr:hemolymph lipopolysaccharide-binding protein-like [Schistocerca gregaria]